MRVVCRCAYEIIKGVAKCMTHAHRMQTHRHETVKLSFDKCHGKEQ